MGEAGCMLWILLCAAAAVSEATFNNYPVVWSTVPEAGTTTTKNLTANCICDLQQDVCNTACCCDPACVAPVVTATQNAGQCLPQGPPNETLNYCVPNSAVQKVNLPSNGDFYSITVQAADNTFLDKLLCITSSSNPALGDYYPDPPVGPKSNNVALTSCPTINTPATPTKYVFNTPVYVSYNNGSKQPLTLPYPVLSRNCNDQFQVGFMTSIPDGSPDTFVSCVRPTVDPLTGVSTLRALCSSQGVAISTYANMNFFTGASAGATERVPVTIQSISFLDPVSGNLTALPTNSTTRYNSTAGYCRNYIYSVDMAIYYNWNTEGNYGTISEIRVALVVTDVSNTPLTWVPQQIRVVWTQYQPSDPRVLFSFSGNPGYLSGFPVLAGTLVTQPNGTKQAISRYREGLPMPIAFSDGTCSGVSMQPVGFDFNGTTSCHVPLTADMLAYFCTNVTSSLPAATFLSAFLDGVYDAIAANSLYMGIWGNSNTSNIAEWIQVTISNWPPTGLQYLASDRSCSNVVVGFDLQILTGVAFSSNNLQSKVLYANLCPRIATWTFPSNQNVNTTAKFYMTSTVSFISKEQQMDTNTQKPAPPLLAPLPEDIFYPFVTSGAEQRTVALPVLAVLALLAVLLACL